MDKGQLRSEVTLLPAAMMLLTCQVVMLAHGLRGGLASDLVTSFIASLALVIMSVVLFVLAVARGQSILSTAGLASLALGVAVAIFVATGAATGALAQSVAVAFLIVALWAAIWSITDSHPGL